MYCLGTGTDTEKDFIGLEKFLELEGNIEVKLCPNWAHSDSQFHRFPCQNSRPIVITIKITVAVHLKIITDAYSIVSCQK